MYEQTDFECPVKHSMFIREKERPAQGRLLVTLLLHSIILRNISLPNMDPDAFLSTDLCFKSNKFHHLAKVITFPLRFNIKLASCAQTNMHHVSTHDSLCTPVDKQKQKHSRQKLKAIILKNHPNRNSCASLLTCPEDACRGLSEPV